MVTLKLIIELLKKLIHYSPDNFRATIIWRIKALTGDSYKYFNLDLINLQEIKDKHNITPVPVIQSIGFDINRLHITILKIKHVITRDYIRYQEEPEAINRGGY